MKTRIKEMVVQWEDGSYSNVIVDPDGWVTVIDGESKTLLRVHPTKKKIYMSDPDLWKYER